MAGTEPRRTDTAPGDPLAAAARLAAEVEKLRRTAAARPLTDLATGVLAERLGCPPAEAAAQLVTLARAAGLPVGEFAGEIVAAAAGPPRPATGRDLPADPTAAAAETGGSADTAAAAADPADAAAAGTAPEGDAIARAALDHAAGPTGVVALAVWAHAPGGGLTLAGQAGFPGTEAAAWRHVPPGVDTPARRALESGAARWPPDGRPAATDAPTLGSRAAPLRLVLPIRSGGHGLGALELAWPAGAADLPATAEVQLTALAEVCAVALATGPATPADTAVEPAAVLDAALGEVLLLDAVPGPGGAAADFRITALSPAFSDPVGRLPDTLLGRTLADAYPLACADGLLARLLRAHATGEPIRDERLHLTFRGDPEPVTVVLRLGAARTGRGLLVCWQPEDAGSRRTALLRNAQRLARIGGFEEDLTTGDVHWTGRLFALYGTAPDSTPVPLAALAAHVHPDDRPAVRRLAHAVLHRHTEASAVFRLLRADGLTRYARLVAEPVTTAGGRTVGVRGAYQDVTAQHRTEIALSATRERLAGSEQESAERGRLALRLQRALLPAEPPPLAAAGLAAAVRYRPAAEREKVGGDWYDALLLPDKSALLSLGDVAGHGVEAATGMVVLRNALRGLAMTGATPGQLMEWLNLAAMQLPEPTTATAVCARYDPSTRELRWARAGHLPPVLIRDGEPTLLPLPRGVLLGAAGEQAYEERSAVLAAGDVLLLYTDGLIERREGDVGMLRELLAAAGPPGADLGDYLDRLLLHSRADTGDDTCLIAVRTEPV